MYIHSTCCPEFCVFSGRVSSLESECPFKRGTAVMAQHCVTRKNTISQSTVNKSSRFTKIDFRRWHIDSYIVYTCIYIVLYICILTSIR